MQKNYQDQILDLLIRQAKISAEQKQKLKAEAKEKNLELEEVILLNKIINEEEFYQLKAQLFDLPYINLEDFQIDREVMQILPQDLALNYNLVVFELLNNELKVGLIDPADFKVVEAIEFLARKNNFRVKYHLISPKSFDAVIKKYGGLKEEVGAALGSAEEQFSLKGEAGEKVESLDEMIKSAPVSKIVSVIMRHAVEGGASDIHIEPVEDKTIIRYRVDGVLNTSLVLPIFIHSALITRIKILANLKIDETRIPQDGRIRLKINNRNVDFRISILPLVMYEKAAIRVLESPDKAPTLKDLGFMGAALQLIEKNINKPNGMFLVTGPTGSGKSTTLFSCLSIINKEGVNISTLEDPVEYFIKGVNQCQIRPEVGFTFANGLRALLRQDPNIVMVGEIRDRETAELAIHAALTGHLVLSTLHTNDAVGAIPRLVDMGVEPFLLSSTINLVIAQRLIRKICERCKTRENLPSEVQKEVERKIAQIPEAALLPGLKKQPPYIYYRGEGCVYCGQSGFHGRVALCEVINISENMRNIIAAGSKKTEVNEELKIQKFVTMEEDGFMKVALGLTSLGEVLRVVKTQE